MNMPEEAAQAAEQAVRLTYQDKLYMPFVENAKEILPLLEESSSEEGRCFVEEVRKIYNENRRSLSAVLEDENRSSLSILTKENRKSLSSYLTAGQMWRSPENSILRK